MDSSLRNVGDSKRPTADHRIYDSAAKELSVYFTCHGMDTLR